MFCRVHGRLCCGPRRAHFILRPSMGGVRGDGPGPKSPGKGPFLWLSLCLAAAHSRIESTWDLWPLAAETAKEPTSRSLVLVFDLPQSHVRPHNLEIASRRCPEFGAAVFYCARDLIELNRQRMHCVWEMMENEYHAYD